MSTTSTLLQCADRHSAQDKRGHEEQVLELLTTALTPIVPGARPIEPNKPLRIEQITADGQPLHQQSMMLLEESKALLKAYNDVADRGARSSSLEQLATGFRHDHETIGNMIKAGKKVAKTEIEGMLADKYNEIRGRRTLTKDEEDSGAMLLNEAGPRDEDGDVTMRNSEGWGTVAYRASRAAQKLEAVVKLE